MRNPDKNQGGECFSTRKGINTKYEVRNTKYGVRGKKFEVRSTRLKADSGLSVSKPAARHLQLKPEAHLNIKKQGCTNQHNPIPHYLLSIIYFLFSILFPTHHSPLTTHHSPLSTLHSTFHLLNHRV